MSTAGALNNGEASDNLMALESSSRTYRNRLEPSNSDRERRNLIRGVRLGGVMSTSLSMWQSLLS
jgi:hypothetical protein